MKQLLSTSLYIYTVQILTIPPKIIHTHKQWQYNGNTQYMIATFVSTPHLHPILLLFVNGVASQIW